MPKVHFREQVTEALKPARPDPVGIADPANSTPASPGLDSKAPAPAPAPAEEVAPPSEEDAIPRREKTYQAQAPVASSASSDEDSSDQGEEAAPRRKRAKKAKKSKKSKKDKKPAKGGPTLPELLFGGAAVIAALYLLRG